jgi:hypothetical protein
MIFRPVPSSTAWLDAVLCAGDLHAQSIGDIGPQTVRSAQDAVPYQAPQPPQVAVEQPPAPPDALPPDATPPDASPQNG